MPNIKKIDGKFIYFLLILNPFIDLINGFVFYVLKVNSSLSPGQFIRMILLIYLIYSYVHEDKKSTKLVLFLAGFFIFQEVVYSLIDKISLFQDLSLISKVFFNIFLLLYLNKYLKKTDDFDSKLIDAIIIGSLVIGSTIIIAKLLNIGVNSYRNIGFKGLFMGLNDVTAVLVISTPLILYRLTNNCKKSFYLMVYLIVSISLILLGTKTGMLGIMLITIYYLIFCIDKKYKKKIYIASSVIFAIFLVIFSLFFWKNYSSTILARQIYFFKKMNIFSYLVSGRDTLLRIGFRFWFQKWYHMLIGVGYTRGDRYIGKFIPGHGIIEMDLFDILYFYGPIIFFIVLRLLLPIIVKACIQLFNNRNLLEHVVYISLITGFIISLLGGHILLSPLSGPYFMVIVAYSIKLNSKCQTDKKTICLIGPDKEFQGGISTVINQISNSYLNKMYNFEMISSYGKNKLKQFIIGIANYVRLLITKKVEIVHIHTASKGSFVRKSIFILLTPQSIPVILHVHGGGFIEFYTKYPKFIRYIINEIIHKTSHVIVLSENFKNDFIKCFDLNENKITKISNGIQLAETTDKNFSKEQQLLYLGKLNKTKGIYDFLCVLPKFIIKYPNIKVIIAGDGEIENVRNIVNNNNMESNVKVVGWIAGEEKRKYLTDSSILVFPSYFEAFGISIIEAMNYGMAVVATKVGGIPEIVENGVNGILIEAGDLEQLFLAIESLLNSQVKRMEIGKRNINDARRYSLENTLKELNKIYLNLSKN